MDLNRIIQVSLAIAGILNFLSVAFFLFITKRGNIRANRILGVLLISICSKLSFAILINIKHRWGLTSLLIHSLSVAAYLSLGPLLLLYFKAFFQKKVKTLYKILIFIPVSSPFIGLIFDFKIPLWIAQLFFVAFLLIIFFQLRVLQKTNIYETHKKWIYTLFISFVLIWTVVNVLIFDFNYYFLELLIILIMVFYIDTYLVIKHYWLKKGELKQGMKIKTQKLQVKEEDEILHGLNRLMENQRLYIDSELTLPKVASLLNVKVYKLSYVINQRLNMTFNEYINSYRIKDITKALSSPDNQKTKILSIAFDYGFNSLSVFNNAFKKYTNYSPTEYRNKSTLNLSK